MTARKLFQLLVIAMVVVGSSSYRALADETDEPMRLEGTSWHGQETLPGYGDLTFHFQDDGFVTMIDKDGETLGTWRQTGIAVTLYFNNGNVVYRGAIAGDSLVGTARNTRSVWRWVVARE